MKSDKANNTFFFAFALRKDYPPNEYFTIVPELDHNKICTQRRPWWLWCSSMSVYTALKALLSCEERHF